MPASFTEQASLAKFVNGDPIMDNYPEERFERIRAAGYRLLYFHDNTNKRVIIHAYDADGGYVGEAKFKKDQDFAGHCGWTVVHPDHRRHGVNSAMYLLAAKILDCVIVDHWSDHTYQTEDARRFWAAQKDPFV